MLDIVKANQSVYAKEAPLSLAKEVQGLRAVFDEVCNRYSMAVSDVWHIHVPRPEGRSPEGEGVYMPYITHCHAICYINPV